MARLSLGEGLALLKRPLKFKRGDKGPFIVDIQAMFAKLGFDPGEPEGVFVSKTEDAVRVFQSEYGLPVNGVIDAKTLKFLYEEADPDGYPETLIEGAETETVEPGQDSLDEVAVVARVTDRAIVISVGERALGLYEGNQLIKRYPVAIGKPSTPTPVGTHRVLEKVLHPGGALGTRWIGFTYQMHGIHGTNRPELIGQAVSNGCVRMHNSHVEELYEMVGLGAPVIVIVAPVASWSGLGKSPSQAGPASGQAGAGAGNPGPGSGQAGSGQSQTGTGSGETGKPGGFLGPSGPQPKDPMGASGEPGTAGETSQGSGQGRTYTVQPGDSIWAIAKRFGTTVEAIVRINGIRNPELIYPGEVLKIP